MKTTFIVVLTSLLAGSLVVATPMPQFGPPDNVTPDKLTLTDGSPGPTDGSPGPTDGRLAVNDSQQTSPLYCQLDSGGQAVIADTSLGLLPNMFPCRLDPNGQLYKDPNFADAIRAWEDVQKNSGLTCQLSADGRVVFSDPSLDGQPFKCEDQDGELVPISP